MAVCCDGRISDQEYLILVFCSDAKIVLGILGQLLGCSGPWFPHLVFEDFGLGPQTFSNSNVVLVQFCNPIQFYKSEKSSCHGNCYLIRKPISFIFNY